MLRVFEEDVKIKGNVSECDAFFVSPYGDFIPLDQQNTRHINMITNNPEEFGLTKEYVQAIHDKHGEVIGQEGNAREELILEVVKNGWVRGRHYKGRNDFWSINVNKVDKKREDIIYNIAKLVSTKQIDRIGSGWSQFNIVEITGGRTFTMSAEDILNFKLYKAAIDENTNKVQRGFFKEKRININDYLELHRK